MYRAKHRKRKKNKKNRKTNQMKHIFLRNFFLNFGQFFVWSVCGIKALISVRIKTNTNVKKKKIKIKQKKIYNICRTKFGWICASIFMGSRVGL